MIIIRGNNLASIRCYFCDQIYLLIFFLFLVLFPYRTFGESEYFCDVFSDGGIREDFIYIAHNDEVNYGGGNPRPIRKVGDFFSVFVYGYEKGNAETRNRLEYLEQEFVSTIKGFGRLEERDDISDHNAIIISYNEKSIGSIYSDLYGIVSGILGRQVSSLVDIETVLARGHREPLCWAETRGTETGEFWTLIFIPDEIPASLTERCLLDESAAFLGFGDDPLGYASSHEYFSEISSRLGIEDTDVFYIFAELLYEEIIQIGQDSTETRRDVEYLVKERCEM